MKFTFKELEARLKEVEAQNKELKARNKEFEARCQQLEQRLKRALDRIAVKNRNSKNSSKPLSTDWKANRPLSKVKKRQPRQGFARPLFPLDQIDKHET